MRGPSQYICFGSFLITISVRVNCKDFRDKWERLKEHPDKVNYQMTTANTKWKLEGDYFEGCNCDSICLCVFWGDPDEGLM